MLQFTCAQCSKSFNRYLPWTKRVIRHYFCNLECRRRFELADRVRLFWSKVNKTDGCWLWTGGRYRPSGYGRVSIGVHDGHHKYQSTHRFSYELHFGPVPSSKMVCHHCDVKTCVRPDHLYVGDAFTNMRDASNRGLLPKGRQSPAHTANLTKLSEADIPTIRAALAAGVSQRQIAADYGVHQSVISRIGSRKRWGWLD